MPTPPTPTATRSPTAPRACRPASPIAPATGVISGTLARRSPGTHNVTITVTDGTATATDTFTWTVTPPANTPPVVDSVTVDARRADDGPDGDRERDEP